MLYFAANKDVVSFVLLYSVEYGHAKLKNVYHYFGNFSRDLIPFNPFISKI